MNSAQAATTFFVGNIAYTMDPRELQDSLHAALDAPGAILEVRLILSPTDGRSRGFAYVDVATEAAERFAALDGALIGTRQIRVRPGSPRMRR